MLFLFKSKEVDVDIDMEFLEHMDFLEQEKACLEIEINYKKKKKKSKKKKDLDDDECAICLIELSNNQDTIKLACNHVFHSTCIKDWFKKSTCCPYCRYKYDNAKI